MAASHGITLCSCAIMVEKTIEKRVSILIHNREHFFIGNNREHILFLHFVSLSM